VTGEELKEMREKTGLVQVDYAARLGIHPISLSRFERGAEPITLTVELAVHELARRLRAEQKPKSKK
jgi:transcriptional regulator with XRE-family HTH domain